MYNIYKYIYKTVFLTCPDSRYKHILNDVLQNIQKLATLSNLPISWTKTIIVETELRKGNQTDLIFLENETESYKYFG